MSCKSGIYAINTTVGTALAVDSTYMPNTIIRRFGQNVNLAGNGIVLNGSGYYKVDATATVVATAVGDITATLYKDGVAVPGATATATAAAIGDFVALPITALVRLGCNCDEARLTIVMSESATTSQNLSIVVVKE